MHAEHPLNHRRPFRVTQLRAHGRDPLARVRGAYSARHPTETATTEPVPEFAKTRNRGIRRRSWHPLMASRAVAHVH
jgi:hypothetical protein